MLEVGTQWSAWPYSSEAGKMGDGPISQAKRATAVVTTTGRK